MDNEKKNIPLSQILIAIILITVGVYYMYMLSTCNRNRTFVRIIEEKYPKIYDEAMEEAEEEESAKLENEAQ